MNITRENREQGTSLLKVVVDTNDYGEAVDKQLREMKRKANIPGFRPGMVPMGIVKKMYGKGILAEQSYRTASNAVFEYLQKEKIDYLGDVIPSDEQGDFDFDNNTEFEFLFEIGEAPKIDMTLSAEKDKLTYNKIKVDKKMHEDYRSNYLRRYGRLVDVETVEKDEALNVTLDNGELRIEEAYVGLISMSEQERAPFIGKQVGYKTQVDINELYKKPEQRAAVLQVKAEELEGINPKFELEITKIRRFADPELNEEFFKMAFPAGNVTSEKEFDYVINEGKFSREDIEKDFDQFLKMFTWNYLQKHFIEQGQLTVTADEAMEEAKVFAQAQFAQYGMPSAPAEMLENFAKQIMENKEQQSKVYEKLYEVKVVEYLKSQIKVSEKSISADDFAKLAKEVA